MIEPTDAMVRAFMMAAVWTDDDGVSSFVFDFMKEAEGDERKLMGIGPSTGTSLLANDEMLESHEAVIRAGLRAALSCKP